MDPRKAAAMIVLIWLGSGSAAPNEPVRFIDGELETAHLSRFSPSLFGRTIDDDKATAVKEDEVTLSEYIWSKSTDLAALAWTSLFIAGVNSGDLDPNAYGKYMVQDAVWLREIADLWQQLSNKTTVPQSVRDYGAARYASWTSYAEGLFKDWNIKDQGEGNYGVFLGDAAENYLQTVRHTLNEQPIYMMIVLYPCAKLWPYLAQEMAKQTPGPCPNLYHFWIDENQSNSSAIRQAAQIDMLYEEGFLDQEESLSVFRQGMMLEINFFNLTEGVQHARSAVARADLMVVKQK